MGRVIDTCVWIDFFRPETPAPIRQLAHDWINTSDAQLCEPIRFELLTGVGSQQRNQLEDFLATMPLLPTPTDLWLQTTHLGSCLSERGIRIAPVDLCIAAICLHHEAELVTFDAHFQQISEIAPLKLIHLVRPK